MIYTNRYFLFWNILVILFVTNNVAAQNNETEIKGKVVSSNGQPISYVRVVINDLKKQTFSNSTGRFSFKDISQEKHNFSFSRIGYLKIDTNIFVHEHDELSITLQETDIITDDVVVTGTRTYKHIEDMPIPTEVISKNDIQSQSYSKLDEILSQQAGLPVLDNRGKGVQIQGLDPDYTLILLNGEPVAGRTGGVLDISRFNINNVSRVEIVRGPSSSLYGSNALAGVINLITEKPNKPLALMASARYGSHNTVELTGESKLATRDKKLGLTLYGYRSSSDGYSLVPGEIQSTIPVHVDYTANGEFFYDFSRKTNLKISGRYLNEKENSNYITSGSAGNQMINDAVDVNESNLALNITHTFSDHYTLQGRLYNSRYDTHTSDVFAESGKYYDSYEFEQRKYKAEIQSTSMIGSHEIAGGIGGNYDQAFSPRISNGDQSLNLFYGYL